MQNIFISTYKEKKTYAVLHVVYGSRFETKTLVTSLTHLLAKLTQHLFWKDLENILCLLNFARRPEKGKRGVYCFCILKLFSLVLTEETDKAKEWYVLNANII